MLRDIHTHILPSVDDGSNSCEISAKMLELEILNDVNEIVLTPHYHHNSISCSDKHLLKEKYNEFIEKFKDLPIKFVFGAELYFSNELMHEFNKHEVITFGDSNYVLIEFPLYQEYYDIASVLSEIIYLGYQPILAHPERYEYMDAKKLKKIKDTGTLIQVNTSSILGDFGKSIQKNVFKFIKADLVDFMASDCHSLGVRKPNLKEALEFVKKKFNKEIENKINL